jgi:outer membrane protein OmpA-like peptidoglycan-associated protein
MEDKKVLEENLTSYIKKEEILVAKISDFPNKIDELVNIAEEISKKAEAEFITLFSQKKTLENNLSRQRNSEIELKSYTIELEKKIEKLKSEKVEAERLAQEKLVKEQAEKEAAEAKAKAEAEIKLMNAFSLTKVAFQTGSMQLTSASKKRLDLAINTMNEYEGYTYKIQGHTDSRGKEAFNLVLSTKRAESVKVYLVSKGIDEKILSAEGFGSLQPIASNDTRSGREENRRVVFEIIK